MAGSAVASVAVYYYILGEYKIANEMLSDDISVCLQLPMLCP
jgi:NADH:ubiquinone oxidoreductase subunit F (NADH-binding)